MSGQEGDHLLFDLLQLKPVILTHADIVTYSFIFFIRGINFTAVMKGKAF